jgi:thiamine biosynthesis lipoprotein
MAASAEHRFAHEAMATTFEVFVVHSDRDFAARAVQEAFDLVDRLESELSHYLPTSDVGRFNAASAGQKVKVGPDTFDCMEIAQKAWTASSGVFDVTIGALYRAWRDEQDRERHPTTSQIKDALSRVGMDKIRFDRDDLSLTKSVDGLRVSLGGIGKGFALDLLAAQLRENHQITRVLLHSGHSTILAGDPPSGETSWEVGQGDKIIALSRRALSSSGTAVRGAHVFDPRTGQPAHGRRRVWAYAGSGAVSDAASTAAMMMTEAECTAFTKVFPGTEFVLTA